MTGSDNGNCPSMQYRLLQTSSRTFVRNFTEMTPNTPPKSSPLRPLPALIFASRWLQLPLYLGLIAAQGSTCFISGWSWCT
jgi:hypothetical protein